MARRGLGAFAATLAVALAPAAAARPAMEYPLLLSQLSAAHMSIAQFGQSVRGGLRLDLVHQLFPPDKIACRAAVAGRPIRGTPSYERGNVGCTWRIPPGSKGKLLRGTIAVTDEGQTLRRSFVRRIR